MLVFLDPAGAHRFEFHQNAATFATATPVAIPRSGEVLSVDAGLALS